MDVIHYKCNSRSWRFLRVNSNDSYDKSHSSTFESTIIMHKLPGLSYMVIRVKRLDLTLQS